MAEVERKVRKGRTELSNELIFRLADFSEQQAGHEIEKAL
jgi:hypothetical protein